MKRNDIKKSSIRGIIIICILSVIYVGYSIAPGMNPYSERYEFNVPSDQLIASIEKFKNENEEYKVPQIDLSEDCFGM